MIALFGGTFNPVHQGHISLALEVQSAYSLQSVRLLPSHIPVHREQPESSAELRREMVALAIQSYPQLSLDDREIARGGHSYTVDTLSDIRQSQPGTALCWLMGADSFNGFLSWKEPARILKLANLIVCSRPGVRTSRSIFTDHYLRDDEKLGDFNAGRIAFFAMQPNDCSATRIRRQLAAGEDSPGCLSAPVLDFIIKHKLYRTVRQQGKQCHN